MYKKIMLAVAAVVVAGFAFSVFVPSGVVNAAYEPGDGVPRRGSGNQQGNGNGSGTGVRYAPLSDEEEIALQEAILEEYGALNLYNDVIKQLGEVIPFTQIASSEQQHINALVRQADKYGVEVPANPGLTAQTGFDTLAEACQAGVAAEIADAALYDDLKLVTTHSDLLRVYDNLQSASLNNHLPEFQACD